MKHLVMVGACYLDTILSVPHFPHEDAKLRATSLKQRRGGNCGNSLEVLQQLVGCSPRPPSADLLALHLVTTLPSRHSAATAKVYASFAGEGRGGSSGGGGEETPRVDLSRCIYREDQSEAASSYILRSAATGSRTIVNHNDLLEMTVEEFVGVAESFKEEQADTWWHFEGRIPETTLQCIQHLRLHHPQSRISVEVEKPGRDGLRELAREADVVFYSRSWAEGEGYATAEACLTDEVAPRASLLLCTWGARGACAMSPPGREVIHAEPVSDTAVHIVDAIGAGDTFIAGIMYGVLCRTGDWGIQKTVKFAVDLATIKVQQDGFELLASKLLPAG